MVNGEIWNIIGFMEGLQ